MTDPNGFLSGLFCGVIIASIGWIMICGAVANYYYACGADDQEKRRS